MKNILTTIFCGVGLLLSTSCQKDFEKINTNPNRPQKPLSYALFNSSDKLILSNTRVYTTSGQMMRSWMQYTAQTTYTTEVDSYIEIIQEIIYGDTLIRLLVIIRI